jgi:transcriptional antiterminator Rof (Rho-off)
MPKPYTPISCSLHDELEARATRRTTAAIEFTGNDGPLHLVRTIIVDVFSRAGVEYLKTFEGTVIRLDALVSVDGQQYSRC